MFPDFSSRVELHFRQNMLANAIRKFSELIFIFIFNQVDPGDAFFDQHIPECAKGGIHAGAKLGAF